jgi:hypothetical protein
MPRIVRRLIAIACWLAPLVWFAWTRAWVTLAICLPITATFVAIALRQSGNARNTAENP